MMEGWWSLTTERQGGQNFFIFSEEGDRNSFPVRQGGPFFLPRSKGGPEKIGDSSSQIDTPRY